MSIQKHIKEHKILGVVSGGGASPDHGTLTGLGDDDHSQYLLVAGTRALTGNLDLGAHNIINVGSVDGRDLSVDGSSLDTHIADGSLHFTEGSISHTNITNIGTNSHATIDIHIADGTKHFLEGSIDHTNILNIGTNTHTQIDTHISDGTLHFTESSISHLNIGNIGTNSHPQIDNHINDSGDDHLQYAALGGRSTGQILAGGTGASATLTLQSTVNATKGNILFGTSVYDEVNNRLGINLTSPSQTLEVDGHILIKRRAGSGSALQIEAAGSDPRPMVRTKSSSGTQDVPTDVALGRIIGGTVASGYSSGVFREVAEIKIATASSGTISGTSLPTVMRFYTTPDLSVTRLERMTIDEDGKVGIGISSNIDNELHVHRGSAGTITSNVNAVATLENDTHNYLQFLTPNLSVAGIRFGDPENDAAGRLYYSHPVDSMYINTAGATRVTIDSSGLVGIGLTPANEQLELNGAILLGNASGTVNGTVRYTGSDFEGRVGGAWESLTRLEPQYISVVMTGNNTGFNTGVINIFDTTTNGGSTSTDASNGITFSGGIVTVVNTGTYRITVTAILDQDTAGTLDTFQIFKNGTTTVYDADFNIYIDSIITPQSNSINIILDLAASDYIEFEVEGNAGTAGIKGIIGSTITVEQIA